MITSKQDALSALSTLFGTTTPRLPDLSTEELNFVEGFINPVVKASEEKVILGYAYISKEGIATGKPMLSLTKVRPTHVLPTGHAVEYTVAGVGILCGVCAGKYRDTWIEKYSIGWDDDLYNCDECGCRLQMLSEYMEGI